MIICPRKGYQTLYKVIEAYGVWVVFKATIHEDMAPKLRKLVQIGKPHLSEQHAHLAIQRHIEDSKVRHGVRQCRVCGPRPASEFNVNQGGRLHTICKSCFSEQRKEKRLKKKSPERWIA